MKEKNIVLVGFMGVGKSTVSAALAARTGAQEIDTDAALVAQQGMSISEMFARHGEPWFRQKETELCLSLAEPAGKIISCGGGVVMRQQNVQALRRGGVIVLLTARPETILKRVGENDDRPLLRGRKTVEGVQQLLDSRLPAYRAAADLCVATDGKTVDEICTEILRLLSEA